MTVLVVGASGATGQLLVGQLLDRGLKVKAIVRTPGTLPERLRDRDGLSVIRSNLLDISESGLVEHLTGCGAVASCLGHNLSLRGIFGPPRMLVTEATRRLCAAIKATEPKAPIRFVLMNTAGNRNRDTSERVSRRSVRGDDRPNRRP
jgi:uncharacterized protein YbjT (DUF2867 family)